MLDIGSSVRSRRKERKLSQKQVSELAGVALNVVKAIEANRSSVTLASLQKVLTLFGLAIRIESGK